MTKEAIVKIINGVIPKNTPQRTVAESLAGLSINLFIYFGHRTYNRLTAPPNNSNNVFIDPNSEAPIPRGFTK